MYVDVVSFDLFISVSPYHATPLILSQTTGVGGNPASIPWPQVLNIADISANSYSAPYIGELLPSPTELNYANFAPNTWIMDYLQQNQAKAEFGRADG